MKWLKFKAAYVDGAWCSPYFIQLNKEGRILASTANDPGGAVENHENYLIPGVPNGHSHAFQYVMSGLSERMLPGRESDDFWLWREQMYALANDIQLDELLAVATQLYMNMLEQGYTSVCEFHYLHHEPSGKPYPRETQISEILMEAAQRAGMGLTLTPVYYQQAAPNVPIKPQQKRFHMASVDAYLSFVEQAVDMTKANYPEVIVGHGVHSLRAAGLEDIKTILGTPWTKGPAHLHASEQTADVKGFVEAYGVRPIQWLADNIPLSSHHNLVHATHMDAEETSRLAKSGATVVICPTTEANLGDGIFPFGDYHRQGGSWCIGSDSQMNLNPFWEMAAPEQTLRLTERKRNVLCRGDELDSGKIVFDRALKGGRSALGQAPGLFAVGRLFEGILLDPLHDRFLERPLSAVLSVLVFANEPTMIQGVYSKGSLRVSHGRHIGRASNQAAYARSLKRLMQSLGGIS